MIREALRFEEVDILRTRGFERHGFTLRDLSPGINLIHGPNGSGKTTTARAIEQLLWPRLLEGERASLAGRFGLMGATWRVEVDGGRAAYEREGSPASAPLLPPMEDHHRYRLSLHDLLYEQDASFARAIIRETAGGYDVAGAGAALPQKASRVAQKQAALAEARAELEEAVAAQRELREKELQLAELRQRKVVAERAQARVAVLEAALEHAEARERETVARDRLEQFPAGMGKVGGNEYERLCQLRERIRNAEAALQQAGAARAAALRTIEIAGIPEGSAGGDVLDGLENDLEALKRAEGEVSAAERACRAATGRLEEERTRIGGALDDARLASLDRIGMGSLAGFVRRAEELRARGDALRAELRLLGEPRSVEDEARLAAGIRMLQAWLREAAPATTASAGVPWVGIVAAGLLLVLGILLAVTVHPLYLLVALTGAGLLWPLLRTPAAQWADPREVYQKEYGKLGHEAPAGWEPEIVERVLEGLQKRVVEAILAAERERRRRELEDRLGEHGRAVRELEEEREEVAERLGVEPDIDPPALAWFADRVSGWQAAHADRTGAEHALATAAKQAEAIAANLRGRLELLGFSGVATVGEIEGSIKAFRQRRQARELAVQELATAEREERRIATERKGTEEEMRGLFAALDLDPDTDDTVRDWCGRHAEYVRARDAHREAGAALREALSRLAARGGDDTLTDLSGSELEEQLAAERGSAAQRDELSDRIAGIEALIGKAKESHNIERALERVDRAEETLRQAREQDSRAAIARELLVYVEVATRDQLLPGVFFRAREIFTRITHGRYELRLLREGEAAFAAYDNQEGRSRTLDELSSGSRVQLLIAVRVAFVEQQEQGVMLPLVLDEVLGNSDDERARAIMEAAVELAKEGRQIFYFTAQADEVARWLTMVPGGAIGVELREIDLLRVRGQQRALEIPSITPSEPRRPPAPDGAGHAEYGVRLEVPRLERATIEPAGVHLWYLVEDPDTLYQLLCLGPDRWGTLEALARDGGRVLIDDDVFAELSACARALEGFADAVKVGVGFPVDRAVLKDSGAVSSVFLDRVTAIAEAVGGDALRLQDALEAGEVKRFSSASKERLQEFLEEHGYSPSEPSLGYSEIRSRVLSRAAADIAARRLTLQRVDRLVNRLWLGIGGQG